MPTDENVNVGCVLNCKEKYECLQICDVRMQEHIDPGPVAHEEPCLVKKEEGRGIVQEGCSATSTHAGSCIRICHV